MTVEFIFLIAFIVFIVAILVLDMCVIDKKAHEVSLKEATVWTFVWIGLSLLFAVFLLFKADLVHGIDGIDALTEVINRYKIVVPDNIDRYDYDAMLSWYKKNMTMSYITGYLIEKMLSVDNLFVMMMIFSSLKVSKIEYQRVLNWGIIGAIVLRCFFIFVGSAAVSKFDWLLLVFGAFLIYSAVKTFKGDDDDNVDVENHPVMKFLSKHFRVYPKFHGDDFVIKGKYDGDEFQESKNKEDCSHWYLTPLFVCMIMIEFADIVFAFDSIPAIFSVSLDPYVVFFSNIFAILGLRAMFFLLSAIVDKFRFLKYGVSVLLLFIGLKLLLHTVIHIPDYVSLIVILGVLAMSIVLSILVPKKVEE